jgi:hypothetical protein
MELRIKGNLHSEAEVPDSACTFANFVFLVISI